MKLYNQLFKKKSVLENWHVPFIVNLASILKPKNYLELGIYQAELFNKLLPLMNDHGIIAIHDTNPKNEKYTSSGYCGDGYKFIEELGSNSSEFEMMTIPVHPGITLLRKRNGHLKWINQ